MCYRTRGPTWMKGKTMASVATKSKASKRSMAHLGEFLIDGGWNTLWDCIDTPTIGLGTLALLGVLAELVSRI